jgi:NDP-sugar pyrophosphorylase family protein
VIAVVLVGGQGTRLRPLTERIPKSMLPVANRPVLEHQVDHLRSHGVDRVILACGYLPDAIRDHFGDSLEYVVEDEPLGTGGAIANAARGLGETFVACNGDILTDLDLTALVEFHRSRGATATIALQHVDDPSRYGLVRTRPDGEVEAFVEKPQPGEADVDTINAGTYVMEPSVLELIPPKAAVSVEREVFPRLVGGRLYGRASRGHWIDVGTPQSYLAANLLHACDPQAVDPAALIDPAAELEKAVVGAGAVVAARARVVRSVLLPGARVPAGAELVERIVDGEGVVW